MAEHPVAGFRKTGIYPVNLEKMTDKISPSTIYSLNSNQNLSQENKGPPQLQGEESQTPSRSFQG